LKRGERDLSRQGRLSITGYQRKEEGRRGMQKLELDKRRDGLLYVPLSYREDLPAPLAVMLHGAGGIAEHGMSLLQAYADSRGLLLLAPASREGTWDIIAE
jgi:phospholipase/carboxylesterase